MLGFHEYIHSYLIEHPGHYFMVKTRTHIYYLDRRYGLLEFHGDYTNLSHQDIVDYILGAIELVTEEIEKGNPNDDGSDLSGHGDDGA